MDGAIREKMRGLGLNVDSESFHAAITARVHEDATGWARDVFFNAAYHYIARPWVSVLEKYAAECEQRVARAAQRRDELAERAAKLRPQVNEAHEAWQATADSNVSRSAAASAAHRTHATYEELRGELKITEHRISGAIEEHEAWARRGRDAKNALPVLTRQPPPAPAWLREWIMGDE